MSLVGLVGALWASRQGAGWPAAAGLTAVEVGLAVAVAVWRRDALLGRLALFGLVAGFAELPADVLSVRIFQTLVYPPEPLIWASPAYMPFSWMAVMVQMGLVTWLLLPRLGRWRTSALMALIGATYVVTYECLAHGANFWVYQDCPMLFGLAPYYVMAAEALILAALPWLVQGIEALSPSRAARRGLLAGAVMFGATLLAHALLTVR